MASFLTSFGVGGVVGPLLRPLASGVRRASAIVSGVVMSGLVYQFAKILYSQQASSELHMRAWSGRSAEVSVAIPAGGVGQIALNVGGERTEHIARSADGGAVARGTQVVITGLGGDSVIVAPAGSPMAGGSR